MSETIGKHPKLADLLRFLASETRRGAGDEPRRLSVAGGAIRESTGDGLRLGGRLLVGELGATFLSVDKLTYAADLDLAAPDREPSAQCPPQADICDGPRMGELPALDIYNDL